MAWLNNNIGIISLYTGLNLYYLIIVFKLYFDFVNVVIVSFPFFFFRLKLLKIHPPRNNLAREKAVCFTIHAVTAISDMTNQMSYYVILFHLYCFFNNFTYYTSSMEILLFLPRHLKSGYPVFMSFFIMVGWFCT